MSKTVLLRTACTVAMLAAAPAFAQSNSPTGSTGPGNTPNTPTTHEAMPGDSSSMTPATAPHHGNGMHHSAMHARMGRTDASQDEAVDRLNDQSLRAARTGQAFNGNGSSDMSAPGGSSTMPMGTNSSSGSMNDMSGGSINGNGAK